jgi:hypothetical protein
VTAPWPCSCGAPGVRNLGTKGYCGAHLAALYRKFPAEVWALDGIGLQAGPRRPDYGPEYVELECCACGAGWIGALLEACPWCAELRARMLEWQAENVLTPPDVDPAERNYDDRMKAWAARLARAVEAELVTREQALTAWHREVDDDRRIA